MSAVRIMEGDCVASLATLPDGAAQCCVTSPPYYGLRDYGVAGQIGLEESPDAYIARLVEVFREVRRVLADDGTLWLNLGDSYNNFRVGQCGQSVHGHKVHDQPIAKRRGNVGYKEKDLLMIPAQMALALRADGWFLRADIIWHKPNPMPESVRDRPTSAHEHVFLLTKRATYFYDAEAIAETAESFGRQHTSGEFSPKTAALKESGHHGKGGDLSINYERERRNARNVWTIATQPFSGAHFATMPPDLAERCIKAGTREGDTVLDPFGGAGTTGLVADRLNRSAILCELNPEYARLARERINGDAPLFAGAA
jgi:DNA modification methylase